MSDPEKHIKALRVRLWLLDNHLIPTAQLDQHHARDMFCAERDALRWVLDCWDRSRPFAPRKADRKTEVD